MADNLPLEAVHVRAAASAVLRQLGEAHPREEIDLEAVGMLARHALAARQQAHVPDGWALVPVEPTPEMCAAFSREWHRPFESTMKSAVEAMLAAAPKAAQPEQAQQSERDDFLQGVCVALQHVKASDSVCWAEIVRAVGEDSLLRYAALVEPAEWELAGFNRFARSELGRAKPRRKPRAAMLAAAGGGPATAVAHDHAAAMRQALDALEKLLARDQGNTCKHENTHRGGAIWEICDDCGAKWADDRNPKPKWKDPAEWKAAEAAIDALGAALGTFYVPVQGTGGDA